VEAGLTTIDGDVPPPGDQENVPPPILGVAVILVEPPAHIDGLVTETVASGLTVTIEVIGVPTQPDTDGVIV
jgi:hypothetical protein